MELDGKGAEGEVDSELRWYEKAEREVSSGVEGKGANGKEVSGVHLKW